LIGSFVVSENDTYTVYAIDTAGNEAVATITIANITRTAPTIDLTISPAGPTNGNVTVTADVTATGNTVSMVKWADGTRTAAYFASGGDVLIGSFVVSENDTYTVYAIDTAGNEAVATITIANITRTAPTIDLTISPAGPTNGNVTVTADITATGNAVSMVKWADGTRTAAYFASGGTVLTGSFEVSANGTYTVYARDEAGNEKVETITIANIARTAPTIDLTISPAGPTNGNVTVTADVTATGSAVNTVKWADGTRTAAYFAGGGTPFTGNFAVSENGTYTVYARDEAGNEEVATVTIANIDRLAPTISLTVSPTSPTNGDVTVTAVVYGTGSAVDSVKWADGTHSATYFASGGTAFAGSFEVNENGTYTVYARDAAGNEAVDAITITNIVRTAPTIGLTIHPAMPTSADVTITAAVYSMSGGIDSVKWADGTQAAAYFASEGTDFAGSFAVSENGAYSVYARDDAGNEAVETITITNIDRLAPTISMTASPTSPANGNVTVTAVVDGTGSGVASVKWAAGNHDAAFFATGGSVATGSTFDATANGVYTVYARDEAGNEAVNTITITNIETVTPPSNPGPSAPDEPSDEPSEERDPEPKTDIELKDGVIVIDVAPRDIEEVKQNDGTIIDRVVLPDDVLEQLPKLLEMAERPIIQIVIDERNPSVQLQLPADVLGKARAVRSDVVFEARLNGSSFQLAVNVLDLDRLAAQLGTDVKNLNVNITIAVLTGSERDALVQAAEKQGMKLLSQAIEFRLTVSGGGRTLEVSDFGGTYMIKSIVLDEVAASRNYTAVLYDPVNGSFTFVPAVSARLGDGRSESVMKMPHNSIYAVMEAAPIAYVDMAAHWAKREVEYMASKRIISGVSKTAYAPDRAITRAEFTALLVRALGLRTESAAAGNVYEDVPTTAWYAAVVEAGARSGLVSGMNEARFAPEAYITREQIAVMLANARALATGEANAKQAADVLSKFDDAAQISPWAQDAVADAVASGLMQGMAADRLAPKATATRAQAAVMLERLLREIDFLE